MSCRKDVRAGYWVVEQIGDISFTVAGPFPCEGAAILEAVDMLVACGEERDLYVDGPGLAGPTGVGCLLPQAS